MHSYGKVYLIIMILSLAPLTAATEQPTEIDGQYYMRGIDPSGEIFAGTGYDVGIMTTEAPEEDGERNCVIWVEFGFQPRGFFPPGTSQTITDVYYHLWWRTHDGTAELGFDSTGSYDDHLDESSPLSQGSTITGVDSYSLTVIEQVVDPQFGTFEGDTITNFTIKLKNDHGYPSVLCNQRFTSFIILNPDPPETLRARDADQDGLTDYDEMYLTFTDPLCQDTDNDGYNDLCESQLFTGMNPNDSHDPPRFGRHLIHDIRGDTEQGNLGVSLSAISDLNDDGFQEIAVGEPGTGTVAVLTHELKELLRLRPDIPTHGFGRTVAGIPGENDHCLYIAAGDPDWSNGNGRIYLFLPSGELHQTIDAPVPGKQFGTSIIPVNDMNSDGYPEIAVGAPGSFNEPGEVFVFSSANFEIVSNFQGLNGGDRFGFSLATIPDLNDPDVMDEILIGAPEDPSGGFCAGAVYLYSSTGSVLHIWHGEPRNLLGYSVCAVGDQDGDQLTDIAVSAPQNYSITIGDAKRSEPPPGGRIHLYSTHTYQLIRRLSANTPGDSLGLNMASVGDLDGDGLTDITATTKRHRTQKSSLVYLSSGNRLLWRYSRDFTQEVTGTVMTILQDADQDTLPEFILGSPDYSGINGEPAGGAVFRLRFRKDLPAAEYAKPDFNPELYFTDPDGDSLIFESVPYGPENGFVIRATDPYGLSTTSNVIQSGNLPPTATPSSPALGVELLMPAMYFAPDDECWLQAGLINNLEPMMDIPLVIVLQISDQYWFYDNWTRTPDYVSIHLPLGQIDMTVISPFSWPDTGPEAYEGIIFWGALLNREMTEILGGDEGLGSWTFGYGPAR